MHGASARRIPFLGQFTAIFASLMTRDHFAISARTNGPNCAGPWPIGVTPNSARRALICGDWIVLINAVLSTATTVSGVRAGASTPYQVPVSTPGSPDSASVGTSGSAGERRALVT